MALEVAGRGHAADVERADDRRDADGHAHIAVRARGDAETALQRRGEMIARRLARIAPDGLGASGGAGRGASVPQGVAREQELPAREQRENDEREQRDELDGRLSALGGVGAGEDSRDAASGKDPRDARAGDGPRDAPAAEAPHPTAREAWSPVGSAQHPPSLPRAPATGLRADVTKVRQYVVCARQTL
nr:hypothetical protein [Candidatus Solirubrobacter pratensis]